MDPNSLSLVARHAMRLLVEGRLDELEEATQGVQLSASDMQEALEEIGAALVMPAEPAWRKMETQAIRNWPGAFTVRMDLWTANGRSDSVLELTVHEKNGKPVIEVDVIGPR